MAPAPIKNVAITAATGALGRVLFQRLVASGLFHIRVLSHSGNTSSFPAGTDVRKVDYNSLPDLTAALQGIDAVVSAVGTDGLPGQKLVIDAAIAAGVRRFLPSEFGSDLENPKTRKLPVFTFKVDIEDYLKTKAAELGSDKFTYTFVYNNAFLDWGIKIGFLVDLASGKPKVADSGDLPFAAATLDSIGDAVVGVLTHPAETSNRAVYIKDITITQNRLIELAKEIAPEKEWAEKPESIDVEAIVAWAEKDLASGSPPDWGNLAPFLYKSIYYPDYNNGKFGEDNELLGIKGHTEEDVKGIIREVLNK